MQRPPRSVLIADDHSLVGAGLAGLLRPEFDVLGIVTDGRQLVAEAGRLRPDLILTDVSMPELNGIEAARQIRSVLRATKIIFVTQQVDLNYLRAAFRAGASGYVSKQSPLGELVEACRQVLSGKVFVTPQLREKANFLPFSKLKEQGLEDKGLTSRRREVLQLLAEGRTAREIANSLHISAKTVEYHKKCLMDATGFRTTAELTRYALLEGLISL